MDVVITDLSFISRDLMQNIFDRHGIELEVLQTTEANIIIEHAKTADAILSGMAKIDKHIIDALEQCKKLKDSSNEVSEIKSAVEKLTKASHKLAEHIYKAAGAQAGAGADTGAAGAQQEAGEKGPEEEVVEAEFEEVDKDKKEDS